jgi:hypothetical protein
VVVVVVVPVEVVVVVNVVVVVVVLDVVVVVIVVVVDVVLVTVVPVTVVVVVVVGFKHDLQDESLRMGYVPRLHSPFLCSDTPPQSGLSSQAVSAYVGSSTVQDPS